MFLAAAMLMLPLTWCIAYLPEYSPIKSNKIGKITGKILSILRKHFEVLQPWDIKKLTVRYRFCSEFVVESKKGNSATLK
jgi:hypothetical protein